MKPGDVVTDEPPIGSIVRDKDGDEYTRREKSWLWTETGVHVPWQFITKFCSPVTIVSLLDPADREFEMTEPGLGAVVEVNGDRCHHVDEATAADRGWIRVDVRLGTYEWLSWHEVCLLGQPVEKLPPAVTP